MVVKKIISYGGEMMFVVSVRTSKKKVLAVCCVIVIIAILAVIIALGRNVEPVSASVPGGTNEERVAYLNSLGWEVQQEPISTKEVIIPNEFDQVFELYNAVQKQQGFGLAPYKGKTCQQFCYQVTNYEADSTVQATLLVCDGIIIGGDLSSTREGGFTQPLLKKGDS